MTSDVTRLSCEEVEELLPLVVDGVIGDEDEPELFRHLAACPQCQASLAAHDLVTLALAPQQKPPYAATTGRYPLRFSWLASAAGIIVCAAAGILWIGPSVSYGDSLVLNEPAVSEPQSDELEVLQILRSGPGREQPLFVVRENGRIVVLPSEELDGGHYRSNQDHPAPLGDQPRHIRASDVRHIGHFD